MLETFIETRFARAERARTTGGESSAGEGRDLMTLLINASLS